MLVWLSVGAAPAAHAQTSFTTTCSGNPGTNIGMCSTALLAAFDDSATITFPGTVPLNGSTFSGPATLSVTMDGLSANAALPSYLQYSYEQSYGYTNIPYLFVTGSPPPNDFLDVTLAGPPQTNNYEPLVSGNSAFFALATEGQDFDFFNASGSDASGPHVGTYVQLPVVFTSSAPPSPSLYLTVNTGGPNSAPAPGEPNGQPTSISANLTLATAQPAANSLQLPYALPSTATTLQQAAAAINSDFVGFNWVQTVTLPNFSYECADPTCSPGNAIKVTGTTNDPPRYGWLYEAGDSDQLSYPFYCGASDLLPGGICAATSTVLSFQDNPADFCIAGPGDTPSMGYTTQVAKYGSSVCGSTLLGSPLPLATTPQMFSTELVGVTSSYVPGNPCDPTTCVDLGGFTWDDNFNGLAELSTTGTGGATIDYEVTRSDFPLDTDSGTGGITILSENVGAVPEPSSGILLLTFFPLLFAMKGRRRYRY